MTRLTKKKAAVLSKVKKRTKEDKMNLVEKIKKCFSVYKNIYILKIINMRNMYLKEFRERVEDTSKIFMGSHRVMRKAFETEEAPENSITVMDKFKENDMGLMFSNLELDQLKEECENFKKMDNIRAGQVCPGDAVLAKGILSSNDVNLPVSMEKTLKDNGMQIITERNCLILEEDFTIITKGSIASTKQSRLMQIFNIKLSEFSINPIFFFNGSELLTTATSKSGL